MTIQDLIAEKRRQIGVLERHIKTLEQMAREEGSGSSSRGAPGQSKAAGKRGGRRRNGSSRAAMVEAYLTTHSGPQPAQDMAAALGLKAAQLHGAIHSGLKTGRFVRGKQRATFALGNGSIHGGRVRKAKALHRGRRSARHRTK